MIENKIISIYHILSTEKSFQMFFDQQFYS